MTCKSLLYAVNTQAQTLTDGAIVNFGSDVKKCGSNIDIAGGNPVVSGCGYYEIDAHVSFTATGAGTAVLSLFKDGTLIPGAQASLTTVASSDYCFAVPAIIKDTCNHETTITATISGIASEVTNAAVIVEKL